MYCEALRTVFAESQPETQCRLELPTTATAFHIPETWGAVATRKNFVPAVDSTPYYGAATMKKSAPVVGGNLHVRAPLSTLFITERRRTTSAQPDVGRVRVSSFISMSSTGFRTTRGVGRVSSDYRNAWRRWTRPYYRSRLAVVTSCATFPPSGQTPYARRAASFSLSRSP